MGLSVLRTAGPRANGILSIRCDRSTRPAASDARLTRTCCRVPCTTKHGHAAHYFAEPWPEHYTRYRRALYNSPYRSAPLESRDHPFCYEGFNHPGRIYSRHAAALATPLPPAWSRPASLAHMSGSKHQRRDRIRGTAFNQLVPARSHTLIHVQENAGLPPTLASMML